CLSYVGRSDLASYGIRHRHLRRTWEEERSRDLDCIGAISVTNLHEVYLERGSYGWLREREPMHKVGYSIFLYDLRKE
ncbi:MAG: hypothetical protein GY953_50385, partial [bacterium]|nr:hypothetical protein [bacterium]